MRRRNVFQDPEAIRRYDFMMGSVHRLGATAWSMIKSGDVTLEYKADSTKVTSVDKRLNKEFISEVEERFPQDIIWGEEESNAEKGDLNLVNDRWLWLIDPIDGTSGFYRGYQTKYFEKTNATIMVTGFAPGESIPAISVIHNPFQRQTMTISAHGNMAYYQTSDNQKQKLLMIKRETAVKRILNVQRFEQNDWRGCVPDLSRFREVMPAHARMIHHPLFMGAVALGDVDVSVYPGPSHPHDVAPGALIVHNAGGDVRTFDNQTFYDVDWRKGPISGTVCSGHFVLGGAVVSRMRQLGSN